MDKYDYLSEVIRVNLNEAKTQLKERDDVVALHGYNNKDRILLEEKIKVNINEAEGNLKELKIVFKEFCEKHREKLAPFEVDQREKNIDLLRRNLNILEDSVKAGQKRSSSSANIHVSNELKRPLMDGEDEGEDEYEDRELTAEEERVLREFKENDDELEKLADQISNRLEALKGKTNKIGETIDVQAEMIKQADDSAEKTENTLRLQNNELQKILNKYRNGKQLMLDAILLMIFIGLLALLWHQLKTQNCV